MISVLARLFLFFFFFFFFLFFSVFLCDGALCIVSSYFRDSIRNAFWGFGRRDIV